MRRGFLTAVGLLALAWLAGGCSPAQVGEDPEAKKAVDALYTAITSRKPELLDRSEARLAKLRDEGKLPAKAHAELAAITAKARKGDWQPAAERLDRFIRGQKDGV